MWPVEPRWTAALTGSHAVTTRVESWRGGAYVTAIDAIAGRVDVTARNRVRRTLALTVPHDLWPAEPTDPVSPFGSVLRVWRGINLGDTVLEVPVFCGRVNAVDDRDQFDGVIEVEAADLMAAVNDAQFEAPLAAPAGQPIVETIRQLIAAAVPGVSIAIAAGVDRDLPVPSGLMWDKDRGAAVDQLAKALGAEVYADPIGGFVVRPVPTLADAPTWALTDGESGTLVAAGRSQSRDGVYNVVVVTAERANGDLPIRQVAADTNPASPTWVGGLFGRVTRFYSSPLITTDAQAYSAGLSVLARSIGAARTRTVSCVPNPALEAGDVGTVTVGGVTETHIADSFTVPIGAEGGAMPITTRSTKTDADVT